MITELKNAKGAAAITSDHWHVVHSRFTGFSSRRPFRRLIHSEHDDRSGCVEAARALLARLLAEAGAVPLEERDEVFVRRPGFKSLKSARQRRARPQRPRDSKRGTPPTKDHE